MSQFIKQEDGSELEVFTPQEVESQRLQAIEDYKTENPDKTGELSDLQEKLKEVEEKLANAGNKDQNFASLRKAKEDAEKKVADILAGVDEKITKAKTEVLEGVMKDHYNETLGALAGEDEELKKKIEFNFKRLGDVAATKQEISKKLTDAYALSTTREDGVSSSVYSSGGVGKLNIKPVTKLSDEEKAFGAKFGITETDIKKHG